MPSDPFSELAYPSPFFLFCLSWWHTPVCVLEWLLMALPIWEEISLCQVWYLLCSFAFNVTRSPTGKGSRCFSWCQSDLLTSILCFSWTFPTTCVRSSFHFVKFRLRSYSQVLVFPGSHDLFPYISWNDDFLYVQWTETLCANNIFQLLPFLPAILIVCDHFFLLAH